MVAKIDKSRYCELRNSKAYHDYFVGDTFEAGIVLRGTEIKSIRSGKAQINDSFVRLDKGIPILYHSHISEYSFGNIHNHPPTRPRKLLLHKKEIQKLMIATQSGGYTVVPIRLYFKSGLAKIEIALCKGKKQHDKREDLKQKAESRDTERYFKAKQKS